MLTGNNKDTDTIVLDTQIGKHTLLFEKCKGQRKKRLIDKEENVIGVFEKMR